VYIYNLKQVDWTVLIRLLLAADTLNGTPYSTTSIVTIQFNFCARGEEISNRGGSVPVSISLQAATLEAKGAFSLFPLLFFNLVRDATRSLFRDGGGCERRLGTQHKILLHNKSCDNTR
jgi:hypothetical protein